MASLKLPDLQSFDNRVISQSTKIYDRTGEILLYDINQGIKRTVIKGSDISRNIKNAAVAIEDAEFYQHRGIKPTAIIRAVLANLSSGSYSQGGSTITQQVIKNALLTTEKSIGRKLKEWILSVKLEREMNKDEILALYLNEAPYGGNIYGVEEAAKSFFGKKASEVSVAEAAYLAALPNAPTFYSPYGGNRQALEKRKDLVLQKMLSYGFIEEEEFETAIGEKVAFRPQEDTGLKAPHFVMYVKEKLEAQFGPNVMQSSGYKVITTLDYDLEKKAEEIVKRYALENEKKYNAENASIVAVENKTGEIIVMAGSRDYFDKEIDGNYNIATALRQPGSSFKPFVYAAALRKGYTPETVLFDVKTQFSTECNPDGTPKTAENEDKCYTPENYDNIYRGPITLRNALAQSINIPAIKVLYLAGLRNALDLASDMGITSLKDPDRYGLTLVLGGGEVSLLDMTSAYSVFANDGVKSGPDSIIRIEDNDGKVVWEKNASWKKVLETSVARKITSVLSDNEARTPAYGRSNPLYFPGYDVAAKTGTTNDYRDAWIVGYTPAIAVGAWAGNNDNTPMEKKVAGYLVAPMWNEFMKEIILSRPAERFKVPDLENTPENSLKPVLRGEWLGGEYYSVDQRTGLPFTPGTPEEYREEKVVPNIHTILYWLDKNNPNGPKPSFPENDSQFYLWEEPIQKWVRENRVYENLKIEKPVSLPTNQETNRTEKTAFSISIVSPKQNTPYSPSSKIPIEVSFPAGATPKRVEYYVNGQFMGSSVLSPFSTSFIPKEVAPIQKYNNVRASAFNEKGEKVEASLSFIVDF